MAHADTVLVFFVYGLASFAMGLVIVVELRRAMPTPLASALRYLAAFGLLHGAAQWILMGELVKTSGVTVDAGAFTNGLFLILSALSALALLRFGSLLLAGAGGRLRWARLLPWVLVGVWCLAVAIPQTASADPALGASPSPQTCVECHADAPAYVAASRGPANGVDLASRYLLFVPACLIAAAGLLRQSSRFGDAGLPRLAHETVAASVTLVASGVVSGIAVPPGPYLPASVVNYATMSDVLGFAPQLLWVVAAFALALFVVRMLGIFEIERRQQLQAAVVEERERIAREMHDGLAQSLGYVGLRAAEAEQLLGQAKLEPAKAALSSISAATSDAYRDVRASILELRSADVGTHGLRQCIEAYAESFGHETGIPVTVNVADEASRSTSPLFELQLIRIVQEALSNVRKHANAKAAAVRLVWSERSCLLTISDDGQGFAGEPARRPGVHFGLQAMRERAESLGGHLRIDSAPGRGTSLTVTIPFATETR